MLVSSCFSIKFTRSVVSGILPDNFNINYYDNEINNSKRNTNIFCLVKRPKRLTYQVYLFSFLVRNSTYTNNFRKLASDLVYKYLMNMQRSTMNVDINISYCINHLLIVSNVSHNFFNE